MMNIYEHGHFSTSGQLQRAIDQTPLFVLTFSLNIFLAFTATIGNTLMIIALHKVSSIHPPTKFLLPCLAMSDFCVGVIVQPLFAAFLMVIPIGNWHILHLTLGILNFTSCGFSLTTATAISVDKLLALLLGLRYRHNNFKTSSLRCCLLLASFNRKWFHILIVFSKLCQERRICCDYNFLVPFSLDLLSR